MAQKVTNLSRNLILVRLASGGTVHLGPGEQTGELADAEVKGNPRVAELVVRHLVAIEDVPESKKGRGSSTKATAAKASESKAESTSADSA